MHRKAAQGLSDILHAAEPCPRRRSCGAIFPSVSHHHYMLAAQATARALPCIALALCAFAMRQVLAVPLLGRVGLLLADLCSLTHASLWVSPTCHLTCLLLRMLSWIRLHHRHQAYAKLQHPA